jgi:hypothetical protein
MHELAVGRGIFIWLIFRSLSHTIGWPATIGLIALVAVGATLARQRQLRR